MTDETEETPTKRRRLDPAHVSIAVETAAGVVKVLHRAGEFRAIRQAVRYWRHTPRFTR